MINTLWCNVILTYMFSPIASRRYYFLEICLTMFDDAMAKLSVLIDADNAQPGIVRIILSEIAKYGTAFVKRAYGDWTGTNLKSWKEQLLKNSIQPIQQFAYTQGKNATDSAMIIDAMDLLYTNRFDGFCLVSSDSDFTRLASRIRESGLVVYGCGERKTPKPFVTACDKFIYIENLTLSEPAPHVDSPTNTSVPATQAEDHSHVTSLLRETVEATSDHDGWAGLCDVGSLVTKQHPDFDARSYGHRKLSELVAAIPMFEVDRRTVGGGKESAIYVRVRRSRD